jgi:hypothetical protein
MMDMMMSWTLCKLDTKAAHSIKLRRLAPGKYEIDRRRVTIVWVDGKRKKELAASEDDVPGSVPMPLLDYLNQASEYDHAEADKLKSMEQACIQANVTFYISSHDKLER